jgi:hypothetical protein
MAAEGNKDRWKKLVAEDKMRVEKFGELRSPSAEGEQERLSGRTVYFGLYDQPPEHMGDAEEPDASAVDEQPAVALVLSFLRRWRVHVLAVALGMLAVSWLATRLSDVRWGVLRVSGTVLLDGRPLSEGSVLFLPERGAAAIGVIDQQGRFTVRRHDGRGLLPGRYRIAVLSLPHTTRSRVIPERYSKVETSGLLEDITEPTDGLAIHLTSD